MRIIETPLKDLKVIEPAVFRDERGYFFESYNKRAFDECGLKFDFVQDNQSFSKKKTLRGFHFQSGEMAQAKLVRIVSGAVLDVVVDLRPESPTFAKTFSIELSSENFRQLLIPKGFGHAFLTLSDTATFTYKCDNFYSKEHDRGLRFDDPTLAFQWPFSASEMIISEKDRSLPFLHEIKSVL